MLCVLAVPVLLLCACSSEEEVWQELSTPNSQYINLSIIVNNDERPSLTRAPLGGENGDGREAGFERESAVKGVTFILADGSLNDAASKIAFIKYFPVVVSTDAVPTDGHGHTNADMEKRYTTGNQLINRSELDLSLDKTYNVYVVANRNIAASVGDNLSTIKDQTMPGSMLFSGDGYNPDGCINFVMASDQDVTVNFTSTTDISKSEESNAVYYQLTKPITIERHAARIDFCTAYSGNTKNAVYGTYDVTVGGTATTVSGYKYEVGTGYFILESITPFNIYNEQQYLFERVTTSWTETPVTTYLGQETTANYIADPRTAEKIASPLAPFSYESPLAVSMATTWQRTAASLNGQTSKTKLYSSTADDNFVLAYCMENTLRPESPLKAYATGLVITGSFYDKDNKFLSSKTVYEYLRHQDSGTTYTITELTGENLAADTRTWGTIPMNFSIVRNNIYRVNIEKIDSGGKIKLKIAVHDWREVTHPAVYL